MKIQVVWLITAAISVPEIKKHNSCRKILLFLHIYGLGFGGVGVWWFFVLLVGFWFLSTVGFFLKDCLHICSFHDTKQVACIHNLVLFLCSSKVLH